MKKTKGISKEEITLAEHYFWDSEDAGEAWYLT